MAPKSSTPLLRFKCKTLDGTLASRALSTICLAVRPIRTLAPSDTNSEPDIPTNNSDSELRSKQLLDAQSYGFVPPIPCKDECRTSYYGPQSRNSTVVNMKPQMMMWNTCNSLRRFTSYTGEVSDATNIESNSFLTNIVSDAINNEGPEILHPMVLAPHIEKGEFSNINNPLDVLRREFFQGKHNIMLENYGLYRKGNAYWHVAQGSKSRYISIFDFIRWFNDVPNRYKETIYNYMFMHQIFVLECCPEPLLKHDVIRCFNYSPHRTWHKLNVSVVLKENLDGTNEAFCGEVLGDGRGRVLKIFHKALRDSTSIEELYLLGVLHALKKICRRRWKGSKTVLEIEHKKIYKVLDQMKNIPKQYKNLYEKSIVMLSEFNEYKMSLISPQGNVVAKRIAYIASHLTVGQIFPIGDANLKTEIWRNRNNIDRYIIQPEDGIETEIEESSDLEWFTDGWYFSDEGLFDEFDKYPVLKLADRDSDEDGALSYVGRESFHGKLSDDCEESVDEELCDENRESPDEDEDEDEDEFSYEKWFDE